MCILLYVGSRRPWQADCLSQDGLTLAVQPDPRRGTPELVGRPHVAIVTTNGGACACAFNADDATSRHAAQLRLAVLGALMGRHGLDGDLSLVACWDGDEAKPPVERRPIMHRDLGDVCWGNVMTAPQRFAVQGPSQ